MNLFATRSLGACLLAAFCASAQAQQLYFTDLFWPDISNGQISRVNPDMTGLTTLVPTGGGVRGFDVDVAGGKMYWADVDNFYIRRSNLDGTGQEDLIPLTGKEIPWPSAIAVDHNAGKFYWGDQVNGNVSVANLDGTNNQVLFSTPFHRGLELDLANGKMYWSTSISDLKGEIWRANLDGSGQEIVVSSLDERFKPNKLALDITGGKIYWTDYVVDIVRRSNLDGTNIETLFVPPFNRNPQGITLDLQNGIVYWGQDIEIEGAEGKIMSMGLDGSNPQDRLFGFGHVFEITHVVPEPATIVAVSIGVLLLIRRSRK